MTLYELTDDYMRLLEFAEDPDADPEAIADTMDALEGEIEVKAEGYAKVIKQIEADADGIAKEIERLQQRRKTMENNIKGMKLRLQEAMEATGKTKFKTELFSFGIQNNPPRLVVDGDLKDIPESLLIPQDPIPDKKAIKALLDDGFELGYAHIEQGRSLRIR